MKISDIAISLAVAAALAGCSSPKPAAHASGPKGSQLYVGHNGGNSFPASSDQDSSGGMSGGPPGGGMGGGMGGGGMGGM